MSDTILKWNEFAKVEMRVGTIISAKDFNEATNSSYIIMVDFGEYVIKKTSAQITNLYSPTELIGKQVIAVVNFPPKQIANIMSECLILGAIGDNNEVIPIIKQTTRYKSFLFSFIFVKNSLHSYCYAKNFCLVKENYILIYLSGVLHYNWYYTSTARTKYCKWLKNWIKNLIFTCYKNMFGCLHKINNTYTYHQ